MAMNKHIKRLMKKKIAFVGSSKDGKPYIKAMLVSRRENGNVFYFDSNNGSVRVAQWNPFMKSIYKGGIDDPDYCVLRFTATAGRYYSMYNSEDFDL